ncbi:Hydrogenase-4 component E [Mucinivorans hirudinis]|uniref:Hydrogenase-4 component E n=1 Tax=Mucinivorans hirudinis TaxID=1433126 RepID=A0A060R8A2_9BACT|nr:Hydrogenase-4 component E [Mucinivorans hirudinis]
MSLLYICIAERFRHYALLVGLQGWVLMFVALANLGHSTVAEQIFVVAETLIFKGILVPYMLFTVIKRTKINKVHRISMPTFISALISVAALIVSLTITKYLADSQVNSIFFGISLFGLLTGLILITTHRRIFSHLIGFLVIENGVFLFSLAVGVEMPFLINVGILLDILMGVLMLGLFINKIGERMHSLDSEELTKIKD